MNAKPPNSNTVTAPKGIGSVDGTTVAVILVVLESPLADVKVALELVEAVEAKSSVVKVVMFEVLTVVVAAVLVSSSAIEVVTVTFGQHITL